MKARILFLLLIAGLSTLPVAAQTLQDAEKAHNEVEALVCKKGLGAPITDCVTKISKSLDSYNKLYATTKGTCATTTDACKNKLTALTSTYHALMFQAALIEGPMAKNAKCSATDKPCMAKKVAVGVATSAINLNPGPCHPVVSTPKCQEHCREILANTKVLLK